MSKVPNKPMLVAKEETEQIALSAAEQEYLSRTMAAIETAQHELRGALNLIIAQRNLEGRWMLSDNNTALVKASAAALQSAAPPAPSAEA